MAAPADDNIFRILVATDMHLGYAKNDPTRSLDSLETLQEVLELAIGNNVDFMLLAGDLFHDNQPPRFVLHQTMTLFRQFCLGDRPLRFQALSDPTDSIKTAFGYNFEDPNYNVSLPVFSIHGNHDDPQGDAGLCALDLLSSANVINHFGQVMDLDKIHVVPICLQKQNTKLALYGIGSIRDERLHRIFLERRISFAQPEGDNWFKILVIHQNRVKHGEKNYIPESFLPADMNLIVWGHEHKCEIEVVSQENRPAITQPGSTVATALSAGEAEPKHVGILEVALRGEDPSSLQPKYRLKKKPLRTVRPFEFADMVHELIRRSAENYQARFGDADAIKLPLIRLRVDYSGGYPTISSQRFGQKYVDKVANPKDILLFHRRKLRSTSNIQGSATDPIDDRPLRPDAAQVAISDLLQLDRMQLRVLRPEGLRRVLQKFVEHEENSAVAEYVKTELIQQRHLSEDLPEVDELRPAALEDPPPTSAAGSSRTSRAAQAGGTRNSINAAPRQRGGSRASASLTVQRASDATPMSANDAAPIFQRAAARQRRQPVEKRGASPTSHGATSDDAMTTRHSDVEDDEDHMDSDDAASLAPSAVTHVTDISQVSRIGASTQYLRTQGKRDDGLLDQESDDEDYQARRRSRKRSKRR
ncbi:uncharacterized protein MONBRDRAFT_25241 [Monosiga brevicollis MX1]|uniref:Double-strand break repair protein n=1 Tax=Monosiga brevicollis TaxID=81824 RepID=A9UYU1_MONBE|nr:uncharacterized protein MONBRDRAFT_25241 [Monosiga brevicollis MX1]EDQ89665.1 predicted protein [Monosiga brevicollis MX1]|eukprot:XP_001745694.1 hypothetical protein [Monosiga brevicollis MX1]